ncbi:N-acetylmuramoyl-L-alanine amidase [Clostridium chauvoei]|uniref:N-acetylmuramoyl-L-alanine amidase n=1 Tax=Clostridium chauvoei TaxID=46867 RepID=UPI001C8564EC|nr:N-acetylmuramoyl-L-alanine amidase [Clostridium chauvoei]MBX7307592.1 N-acetylmuramoyl-L-alanine amidase [Clostridium chauvoei]
MKKIKNLTLLTVLVFIFNIIMPVVNVNAVMQNTVTEGTNIKEETNKVSNDVKTEKEPSLEKTDGQGEDSVLEKSNTEEQATELSGSGVVEAKTVMQPVTNDMIISLENPLVDHNLTDSFFVKGWALSSNNVSEVEVFVDNKSVGQATYGVRRNDISKKYPNYPNSSQSGFTKEVTGISNGAHTVKVVATDIKGVTKEASTIINVNNAKTVIMSEGVAKRSQMISFLQKKNSSKSLSYITNFVDWTLEEAATEGINADILFAQIMLETGYLKFGGDVKEEQNNFAGLGAVGNGAPGESFPSIQIGIRAVVQHLKAYASTEPLKLECVDTRFGYVERGCAKYVEHLGIKENPKGKGWAVAQSYGYSILRIVNELKREVVVDASRVSQFNVTGELKTGSNVTLTGKAEPSADSLYKFIVKTPAGEWITVQDFSNNTKVNFVPETAGEYRFVMHIKHKNSSEVYDDYTYVDKTVKGVSNVTDLTIKGNNVVNGEVTFIASAKPEVDTLYKFIVKDPSGAWTDIQDYSSNNTVKYTPKKAGVYRYVVHVKHKTSTAAYDTFTYKDVDVIVAKDAKSTLKSFNVTGDKFAGSTMTMTATADPSASTLYKFIVRDGNGKWITVQDYSNKNTAQYKAPTSGEYRYVVHVKHQNSGREYDDYTYTDMKLIGADSKVTGFTVTGERIAGTEMTLTAKGTPSEDTLYKFIIKDPTGKWTDIQDFSAINTIKYTPQLSGEYRYVVHVKHKTSGKAYDDYTYTDLTVKGNVSTVKKFDVTGEKVAGAEMTLTATGTPEADTLYKFIVKDPNGKWTDIQDYSNKNTVKYTPQLAGEYRYVVHVKHKTSAKAYDDYTYTDLKVTGEDLTSKIESFTVTGDKIAGSTMTMTAKAQPAADTLYKFIVRDSEGKWVDVQDFSAKTTADYKPLKSGDYRFVVHIKHKGSKKAYDDFKFTDITVKASIIKTKLKSFEVTGENFVGSNISLKAEATEANSEFKFMLREDSTGNWFTIQDYSARNKANFNFVRPGNYRVVVHTKHATSENSYDDFDYRDVVVSVSESKLTSFNATGVSSVGKQITMSASADQAADTLYKFIVKNDATGEWITVKDFDEINQAVFTPESEGAYRLVVHAKHRLSKKVYDDFRYVDVVVRNRKLVVVDAGHNFGGDDGAYATHNGVTYSERDLNMQVAVKVQAELESRGFEVVMTRKPTDRETLEMRESLKKRVNIANSLNADFFVSIHQNTVGIVPHSATGMEVYYSTAAPLSGGATLADGREVNMRAGEGNKTLSLQEKIAISRAVGSDIVNTVTSTMGINNRGLKDEDFYVVKNTLMPSVLVECGFISNPEEAKNLANNAKQQQMAKLIVDSISRNL